MQGLKFGEVVSDRVIEDVQTVCAPSVSGVDRFEFLSM